VRRREKEDNSMGGGVEEEIKVYKQEMGQ